MEETFAQSATSVGVLRSILDNYPFSVGLFREMLQNSDDAGATTQAFVLDHRNHSTDSLSDTLARAQGPAFLAHNNAKFNESNWRSIQAVYESSKGSDSSKIGKYGVGFRSVFHITDCPQIISGETFAMFDPLKTFTGSVGMKTALSAVSSAQLSPFGWFMDEQAKTFDGTIIRCPLRRVQSQISKNVVTPDTLAQLFKEFIANEAKIALLFLQNVESIVMYDISPEGVSTCMLQLSISRSVPTSLGENSITSTATVTVEEGEANTWRVLLVKHSQDDAAKALSSKDSEDFLKENKLLPHVGIAAPMDGKKCTGRLFTFLPLPLPTGFPVHIHAYFALTQSRQNLRNSQETGLIEGTDDHLLIAWNKLLFERYIPNAWKIFLEVVVKDPTSSSNIFELWPPQQQTGVASGENVYWRSLPTDLFHSVTSSSSAVWPVFRNDPESPIEYRPLDSLITAESYRQDRYLRSLTAAGLKFTCPPRHIIDIVTISAQFRIISPEQAHMALLECTILLRGATKDDIACILEYLLSTKNVLNLVDLPLIHSTGGSLIALSAKETANATTYTMLNSAEFAIFGFCDDHAIALQHLPRSVADVLRSEGPEKINVAELTPTQTVSYLNEYPTKMGLDLSLSQISTEVKNWLSRFWIWLDTHPHKDDLLKQIQPLYLLPSIAGLRKADTPLFISVGEHPKATEPLKLLGAPFLVPSVDERFQRILRSSGLLKSISDIQALLDSLPDPASLSPFPIIPPDQCAFLLKRIANHLSGSLTEDQANRLRSLPLYPVVKQDTAAPVTSPKVVCEWTSLTDASCIYSVYESPFLPTINGTVFVQLNKVAPEMVRHLANASSMPDVALLELVLDHFVEQTLYLQVIALRHISQHSKDIAPRLLDKLRNTPFVIAQDGTAKKPCKLFTPEAPVSRLYVDDVSRQIAVASDLQKLEAQYLTSLKLLQDKLTIDIVNDVISTISLQPLLPESASLSRTLITVMNTSDLVFHDLVVAPEAAWLPTNQGLRGVKECRDRSQPPELFNRVVAVIEENVTVPPSLVKAFKWDQPVPTDVLIQQLELAVQDAGDQLECVLIVLNELGRRELTDSNIESLVAETSNRHWVPTVDRRLSRTADAVFLPPMSGSGFTQIYPVDGRTKVLLQRLGCSDSPSFDEITSKLEQLSRQDPSPRSVLAALSLLRSVRPELNQDMRDRLLIPNTLNALSPYADTFYNDIGDRLDLVPLTDKFVAHPKVDEELSRTLGLRRLGLEYAGLTTVHLDMGETPVVTVRNTLKQYTEKPFATEFLANASDAGATSFSLMCNNFVPEVGGGFLSPTMAKFASCPSLVVHNDATFKDKDFEGICRTGVGGKQQEQDKIGRFGLGALTMFSFTELAVIVSADKVVFLNPSKFHLPLPDRAAVMLSLQYIRDFYPGQLQAIDGLFGFNIKSDQPYHGSIFYLPLREASHLEGLSESVSTTLCLPHSIETMIEGFRELAPSCLFFTQLGLVQGINRDSLGNQQTLWTYTASREPVEVESASRYLAMTIGITSSTNETDSWLIVRTDIPDEDVREDCRMATSNKHFAGLALPIGDESSSIKKPFNFFSTLPLPLSTTLPVHVMGSFVLASDRREIRLDKHGALETTYNQWLLDDVIPALYLFLLERLLEEQVDNSRWWPGPHSESDEKSRLITESFYANHLGSSNRRVVRSSYDESRYLIPREVVLYGDEPDSIKTVLSALEPPYIASLPPRARQSAIEVSHLRVVNPAFLRDEIIKDPTAIHSLDINIINSIVKYLSPIAEDPTFLLGLHILPLADSSFAEFDDREHARDHFYVWRPIRRDSKLNFPPHHFVHPEFKSRDLLRMNMNICLLDAEAMKRLIGEECQRFSLSDSHGISNWIYDFWESWPEYHQLGLDVEHIEDFPLVPTILGTTFVSLRQCRDGSAVLVDTSTEEAESLRACLSRLGLQVVRPDSEPTPHYLVDILCSSAFPLLTFNRLLHALADLPDLSSVYQDIENLDENLQNVFGFWARERIVDTSTYSDTLLNIAQQLPIWPSLGGPGTAPLMLRRASEVYMLPRGISIEAAGRFMNVPVGEYGPLQLLRGPCLRYDQIEQFLETPPVLQPEDLVAYKSFLSAWIPMLHAPYAPRIHVPDGRCHIVSTDTLYSRDLLYRQAFADDAEKFVHPSFADLEPILARHGLNTESDMNMSIFRICAEALNNGQENDLVARAETLFDAYSFHLPVRVAYDESEIWSELDGIPFIPRSMETSRRRPGEDFDAQGELDIPEEITSLPEVVSPMELVREEFEPIAWSQRATFRKQPDLRVLNAHASLGKPTTLQVVLHLLYLSKMSGLTEAQRVALVHDLKETYAYLSRHLSATEDVDALRQIRDEKVFLNADSDDPSTLSMDWQWESADSLVFEIAETEEAYARPVHRFLHPYERLLQLFGVLRVYYPRYVGPAVSHSEVTKLQSVRAEFNRMRQEGILTDVIFVTGQDETSDQEGQGHEVVAHRAFLAASSTHFAEQFKPGFQEGRAASFTDPVHVPMVEHSRACVELVLDFVYTGEYTMAHEAAVEDLLDILRLSGYWDIKDLFQDVQKIIIERRLIHPLTLDKVRDMATLTGAQTLLTSCDDYETRNAEFILRYRRATEENM
ncbi:hypothetical protein D9619_013016 [Psilocybe cf. subviscida]|uniref:BTB domain-containing protein n=1 Tax=Psilocybe cf. subviscida TaxID=2480587 RepID=A0A8H5B034_9AGAR|nr:hypothetical protein D9619_013016 [Psilocybe cf. subviscida]